MNDKINGKSFYTNRKTILLYKFILIFCILMVFGSAVPGTIVTLAIMSVIMIILSKKPILIFFDSYAEFKVTCFAPLVIIRYDQIKNVFHDKKFIYLGRIMSKDLKIRKNIFSAEDVPKIISLFENVIKNSKDSKDLSIK